MISQKIRVISFAFVTILFSTIQTSAEQKSEKKPEGPVWERSPAASSMSQAVVDFDETVAKFWSDSWVDKMGNIQEVWSQGETNTLRTFAKIRDELRKNNLKNPYPQGTFPNLPNNEQCKPNDIKWRTADGRCNDLKHPASGMPGIRFGRNIRDVSIAKTPDEKDMLAPNPRDISRELMTRDEFKPVPFLNLWTAAWIQFMVHDWLDHGDNDPQRMIAVPLKSDDPLKSKLKSAGMDPTKLYIPLSKKDSGPTVAGSVAHTNKVTAWWDLSQIYGSDMETQKKLRVQQNGNPSLKGKLITVNDRLPLDPTSGKEMTGFNKNWWFGLSILHQVFVREHNRIVDYLVTKYPKMTDEELFQTARLINTAVMAKIHTVEWTPAILASMTLYKSMNGNWYGYNRDSGGVKNWQDNLIGIIFDPFRTRGARGLVGQKPQFYGVPFAHSEEFTSIYRMHPLVPEEISIQRFLDGKSLAEVPVVETRDAKSHQVTDKFDMLDLYYTMGREKSGQLVLNNFPNFLQSLSVKDGPMSYVTDMATIDILRDRERGVPRYNEFRKQIGMPQLPKDGFHYLTSDVEVVEKLRKIYDGDVNKMDLLVGALAESHRPEGFGFSETLFRLFVLTASRRLETDRFLTSDFKPEIYTKAGMEWVEKRTMREILLDYDSRLYSTMGRIKNPFRPWTSRDRSHKPASNENYEMAQFKPDSMKSEMPWAKRKPSSVEKNQCDATAIGVESSEPAPYTHYENLAERMKRGMYQLAAKQLAPNKKDTYTSGNTDRSDDGGPLRAFHAKAHGCLNATFKVTKDLGTGVFKSQDGKLPQYKAWVRFSNAKSGEIFSDGEDDLRGIAIKLRGVKGESLRSVANLDEANVQDFLATNAPVHFAKNADEMVSFFEKFISGGTGKKLMNIIPNYKMVKKAQKDSQQQVDSVAQANYYSRTPFTFGKDSSGRVRAAKFRVVPCQPEPLVAGDNKTKAHDYLRQDLIGRAKAGFCMKFQVQYQQNACTEPLDDATVEWKTPFEDVAVLEFKSQTFAGPYGETSDQDRECEASRFNPWHALADHRPLGDMNRARELVYYNLQNARGAK